MSFATSSQLLRRATSNDTQPCFPTYGDGQKRASFSAFWACSRRSLALSTCLPSFTPKPQKILSRTRKCGLPQGMVSLVPGSARHSALIFSKLASASASADLAATFLPGFAGFAALAAGRAGLAFALALALALAGGAATRASAFLERSPVRAGLTDRERWCSWWRRHPARRTARDRRARSW